MLGFPLDTYVGREREAALIMAAVALMPTVRDRDKRRAYGNEIMANADHLLPSEDPANAGFWNKLREAVITMQELPACYLHFSRSNEELIRDYWWLDRELGIMKLFGLGGLLNVSTGGGRGIVQGFEKGDRSTLRSTARSVATGSASGLRNTATGGFRGKLGAGWILGSLVYLGGNENREAIRRELTRRYQESRLSEEAYRSAFGNNEPLPRQYLYHLR